LLHLFSDGSADTNKNTNISQATADTKKDFLRAHWTSTSKAGDWFAT
jgi:hypothetical protein